MGPIIITIFLAIFIAAASYCDIRFRKIYNFLNMPFLILGIITNVSLYGIHGLVLSISGLFVGFFILLLPYMWHWVGGGDVKFLAAAGCLVGPSVIAYSTMCGLILFGIAAVIYLIFKKRIKTFFTQLITLLFTWKYIKSTDVIEVSGRLPLGVFLGIGIIANWIYYNFHF